MGPAQETIPKSEEEERPFVFGRDIGPLVVFMPERSPEQWRPILEPNLGEGMTRDPAPPRHQRA